MIITTNELKNNLDKYIDYIASSDEDILVTENGRKVLQITKPSLSGTERLASLVDSSEREWDYEALKNAAMVEKYGN